MLDDEYLGRAAKDIFRALAHRRQQLDGRHAQAVEQAQAPATAATVDRRSAATASMTGSAAEPSHSPPAAARAAA